MRMNLILLLLLAASGPLAAQDARLERIRQAFPAEAASRIETLIAEAEAAGIPGDPLIAKALEGAAKGVAPERVVMAMSSYAERLRQARSLMGAERDATAVVAGADALQRGVPAPTIQRLAGEHRDELAVPLVVLGDLMQAGVPAQSAYDIVHDALERGRQPEELMMIPAAVRRMLQDGRTPVEAAGFISDAMRRGQFDVFMRQLGIPMGPPSGPPVPPGAGPPGERGRRGPPGGISG